MKHAFMIYTTDREDGGIMGFKCALELPKEFNTFQEAIAHLHPILSSKAFVKELVKQACLEDDLFQGHKFKFVSCGYRHYSLEYEFEYCGDEKLDNAGVVFATGMDFINIW